MARRWSFFLTLIVSTLSAAMRCLQVYAESDFLTWAKRSGVWIHKDVELSAATVDPTSGLPSGRGLVAYRNISSHTRILRIPVKILINIEHALVDDLIGPVLHNNAWISDLLGLALFLHIKRHHANLTYAKEGAQSRSKWDHYLLWLPSPSHGSPLFLPEKVLREYLQPTSFLLKDTLKRRKYAEQVAARVLRLYPHLHGDGFDYAGLIWGIFIVQSRIHGVEMRDARGTWHHTKCLVPVADAANAVFSSELANFACHTDPTSNFFDCETTKNVVRGSQLLGMYGGRNGDLPLGRIWRDYGFVPLHLLSRDRTKRVWETIMLPAPRPEAGEITLQSLNISDDENWDWHPVSDVASLQRVAAKWPSRSSLLRTVETLIENLPTSVAVWERLQRRAGTDIPLHSCHFARNSQFALESNSAQ